MGRKQARYAFISYVREDSQAVDQLQRALETVGIRVWRDTADLWPGEDWRAKIRHAITNDALVFIACFSHQSLAREQSYQNEELALAIDQLRLRRPDIPWLIPVRFDECDIPNYDIGMGRTLSTLQRADLFGDNFDSGALRLVTAVLRILRWNSGATLNLGQVLMASGDSIESVASSRPSTLISSYDGLRIPTGTVPKTGADSAQISALKGSSSPDHRDIPSKEARPHRINSLRRGCRRFLNLNLWQQVVAGLLVLAIAAFAGKLLSSFDKPVKVIRKPSTHHGSLTWLNQLTPITGEIGASGTTPNVPGNTKSPSLPHELMIASAENGNTITYTLDRKYKYLDIQAAPAVAISAANNDIFAVDVDGKAITLEPHSTNDFVFAGLSRTQKWIINVSNAEMLQLKVTGLTRRQNVPLLVSAYLTI